MTPELARGAMRLESDAPRHRRRRRILALLGLTVASLAYAVATGWGALALFYLAPGSETARTALAWGFVALGLSALVALAVRRARRPAVGAFVMAFVLALIVWSGAMPSNDRDWQPEVAVLPYATIDRDRVTVHNIRNFDSAVNPGHIPYSWKVLFSGYAPEYAYERGRLDQTLPFEELARRSLINAAAQDADKAPDFSRRIRARLP